MELQIQKAIELSLASAKRDGGEGDSPTPTPNSGPADISPPQVATDEDLEMAIQLSQRELESHKKRQLEEDEMLEKALALSMNEK